MEKYIKKVSFNKNGKGYLSICKVAIPIDFIRELGLSEDEKEVEVHMENNKIIIEKKVER